MALSGLDRAKLDVASMSDNLQLKSDILAADDTPIWTVFDGPDYSDYEGMKLRISIHVPDDFPENPVTIYFRTPVFNPHISTRFYYYDDEREYVTRPIRVQDTLHNLTMDLCFPNLELEPVMLSPSRFRKTTEYYHLTYAHSIFGHPAETRGFYAIDRLVQRYMEEYGVSRNDAVYAIGRNGLRYPAPGRRITRAMEAKKTSKK